MRHHPAGGIARGDDRSEGVRQIDLVDAAGDWRVDAEESEIGQRDAIADLRCDIGAIVEILCRHAIDGLSDSPPKHIIGEGRFNAGPRQPYEAIAAIPTERGRSGAVGDRGRIALIVERQCGAAERQLTILVIVRGAIDRRRKVGRREGPADRGHLAPGLTHIGEVADQAGATSVVKADEATRLVVAELFDDAVGERNGREPPSAVIRQLDTFAVGVDASQLRRSVEGVGRRLHPRGEAMPAPAERIVAVAHGAEGGLHAGEPIESIVFAASRILGHDRAAGGVIAKGRYAAVGIRRPDSAIELVVPMRRRASVSIDVHDETAARVIAIGLGHALGMRSRHQAIHDVVGVRDRAPEGVGYGDEASVAVIGHPLDGTERIGDRDQTIEIVVAERRRPAARIGLAGEP